MLKILANKAAAYLQLQLTLCSYEIMEVVNPVVKANRILNTNALLVTDCLIIILYVDGR